MFGRKKEKPVDPSNVTLRKEDSASVKEPAANPPAPDAAKKKETLKFVRASSVGITIALVAALAVLLQGFLQFALVVMPQQEVATAARVEQVYSVALENLNQEIAAWQRKTSALAALPGTFNAANDENFRDEWSKQLGRFFPEMRQVDVYHVNELLSGKYNAALNSLSFASQDLLRRVAKGESGPAEAFLKEGRWYIQFAAPVFPVAVSGVQPELIGVMLVVLDSDLLANYVQRQAQHMPGQWAIRQAIGGVQVVAGAEGTGAEIVRNTLVPHWQLAFWPVEQAYRTQAPVELYWALVLVLAAVAAGFTLLPLIRLQKRLRQESILVSGFLQQTLYGDKKKMPAITVDVLNTLMVTLQRVIQIYATSNENARREALKNSPERSTASDVDTSTSTRSAGDSKEAVQTGVDDSEALFSSADPLDIDDIFDDQDDAGATGTHQNVSQATGDDLPDLGELEEIAPLSVPISRTIFRAYDIRGIVGQTVTPAVATQIGLAFGSEAQIKGVTRVCVGYDGRLSSPQLAEALMEGLVSSGCHVLNLGAVPTPVLYFATHLKETGTGVMVTGSHNPANYNGFKMMIAGETLANEAIQKLYQRIDHQNFSKGRGSIEDIDVRDNYFSTITGDLAVASPLKVVVDAGNGIAGAWAPRLIEDLGCEVIPLYCDVDGNFPNHHPDPGQPENLQALIETVRREEAELGIAFDGDGDRIGVVTNKGKIIWPDRLLMLFAKDVVARNPGSDVIYDVKCTRRLNALISSYGGRPVMWKTGHSLMKAKMQETGALLGGEMSGHIFFKERWFGFDDAIYSAARLLEILGVDERSSDEVFASFPEDISTPEIDLPVAEEAKFALVEKLIAKGDFAEGVPSMIDGIRVDFAEGWGLCRASNTTPALVLRFEATSEEALERIKQLFRDQLLAVEPGLTLNF